jgi:hypothetical protein
MAKEQAEDALSADDRETALDAAEVQALFAAVGDSPRAQEDLRQAYARVKNRLTPAGREVFESELERLSELKPTVPHHLCELGEGDWAVELLAEEGLPRRAVLRCRAEGRSLQLALPELGERQLAVDELGRIRAEVIAQGSRVELHGALAVADGYLRLELYADGALAGRKLRARLVGFGDARCGHA